MLKLCLLTIRSFTISSASKMQPKLRIGTHNGSFHCDEVLACSLLKFAKPEYRNAEVIRSRDPNVLKDCDIVVDVGGVYDPSIHRYDHHQRTFNDTMNSLNKDYPWVIKLSSAGLVYYHFGHDIIANILGSKPDSEETKILFHKIYENLIQEIDGIDNGVDPCQISDVRYKIHTHLSLRVKHLNPAWNDADRDETKGFEKATELVTEEFLDRVNFYKNVWLPARTIVKEAIENREKVHSSGEIVELSSGGCPWRDHLLELEELLQIKKIKYILFTDANENWRIQCVPVSLDSFENRLSLKEEWRGLRNEELSKVSGIPDCVFVHASGFIGGAKTRDGVLQMALKTLGIN